MRHFKIYELKKTACLSIKEKHRLYNSEQFIK